MIPRVPLCSGPHPAPLMFPAGLTLIFIALPPYLNFVVGPPIGLVSYFPCVALPCCGFLTDLSSVLPFPLVDVFCLRYLLARWTSMLRLDFPERVPLLCLLASAHGLLHQG